MAEINIETWPSYYRYWGKAKRSEDQPGDAYHLLPYHCLDVAACGYWLVKNDMFGAGKVFQQLGFSINEGAMFFAWLLGVHDIGKFARGFQQLNVFPDLVPPLPDKFYSCRHDSLGFWLWNARLRGECKEQHWSPFPTSLKSAEYFTLDHLVTLSTGHHGKPPDVMAEGSSAFHSDDIQAAKEWISALAELLGMAHLPEPCGDKAWRKYALTKASWPLAGLIVLADWLGSDHELFPYKAKTIPLKEYWSLTLGQAELAVVRLPTAARCASFDGIRHLFPFITQPTPLQQLAAVLPLSSNGAELFILEDVTGAGKTEAALILTNRLLAQGKSHGLYIGLPTMATANAMFDRLQASYRTLFASDCAPSLMLAHGARALNQNFRHSLWSDSSEATAVEYASGEATAGASCHRWFADSRKKALLAEVGVGTLDQALLAVLPFRHQSLRMLGLRGKVLLLDEVHAYDAYMNKLLERLLEFHASQGGSAIILSATLSQQQRSGLVGAFARGGGVEPPELNPEPNYPWVTHYVEGNVHEEKVSSRKEVCREVQVEWRHQEQECLAKIRAAVEAGRCIAWIRNTVDDAICAYQALAEELDADQLLLFHSRFAFIDRLGIEAKVMAWCGKESDSGSRLGKVVISTQVIEQSMDLDLDEMITDLAPIDLLVQRAGRLQRHVRDNQGNRLLMQDAKDGRPAPVLTILAPTWQEQPDRDWLQSQMPGTGYVYPDHGRLWLGQLLLQRLGAIRMPDEARTLVEEVYGLHVEIPAGLQARSDNQQGKQYSERASAGQLLLELGQGYQDSAGRWQEEIEFSTRLGDPTTQLFLARRVNGEIQPYAEGPFSWEMSRLQVRETLWHKVKGNIPHLQGDELRLTQEKYHLPSGQVVLLPDGDCGFYSTRMGFQPKGEF